MNYNLNPSEKEIIKFIENYCKENKVSYVSPTDIGLGFYKEFINASSWAKRNCLQLVNFGFLEKNENGYYKITKKDFNEKLIS